MKKKSHNMMHNDQGNAVLVTTIIIIILTVIVGATISISGIQFDLSMFQRNTSNTYYLATSAIEKQTEMINKAIQTELANNIEKVSEEFFKKTIPKDNEEMLAVAKENDHVIYKNIEYIISPTTGPALKIDDDSLHDYLEAYIFNFIKENFLKDETDPLLHKTLSYNVESDRQADTISMEITILSEAIYELDGFGLPIFSNPIKDEFKMTATAITKNGTEVFDKQTVESIITINVPDAVEHQIRDKYKWVGNPPEILDSAVTCFSDMVVTSGAQLIVEGDIRVKGTSSSAVYADADQSGGLIVSNGGQLTVSNLTVPVTTTRGNIYCINNVATTNGWTNPTVEAYYNEESKIAVAGDIIANTVGIYDDYYSGGTNQSPLGAHASQGNKVRKNNIVVDKNIFVDNDVKIDKWVGDSNINVAGSIFGVSDNNYGGTAVDPNLSSGVFNQGFDTLIKANQMFVHGQPFIVFREGGKPAKLWESIGEPFDGVSSWGGYTRLETDSEYMKGDKSYLATTSPLYSIIKNEAIQIESDPTKSYATASVSAKFGVTTHTGLDITGVLGNQTYASEFFAKGGYTPTMSSFTGKDNGYGSGEKEYIINDSSTYYAGANSIIVGGNWANVAMYKKFYDEPPGADAHFYKGIRRYMTAMRSVFYGRFNSSKEPELLEFDEVVDLTSTSPLSQLSAQAATWSYNHPIYKLAGGTIKINEFYVRDNPADPIVQRPYPSIIINNSVDTLIIKTDEPTKKIFKGIIISKGNVVLEGDIIIEGTIIVGGTEGASEANREKIMLGDTAGLLVSRTATGHSKVTIKQNPDIILEVECGNHNDMRMVMDALKITRYTKYNAISDDNQMAKILGPYNYPVDEPLDALSYTLGRVVLKDTTRLDIKTDKLKVSIKNMKKIY